MVLDTSALLAILFDEPERRRFSEAIALAGHCAVSAATFVEVSMILESRHGAAGVRALDRLLSAARVAVLPVDAPQAEAAREAFRQYGKGRHPAGLNFGDCFAYAVARTRGEPLLFKGADFALTDLRAALEPAPAAGAATPSDDALR
jgi:ribonuclease VapC